MSYATTVGQESYSYIQPFADRRRGALIAPGGAGCNLLHAALRVSGRPPGVRRHGLTRVHALHITAPAGTALLTVRPSLLYGRTLK